MTSATMEVSATADRLDDNFEGKGEGTHPGKMEA
jgi:hypothetical protein